MATFTVNGKTVTTTDETRLIHFLRYRMHLTSVKDGCSEGACGTCTILVDGQATKACTLLTSEVDGKDIITVEGLSEREKEIYTYAFGKAGAVQCGFCIPGMVICAKGLLDRNPDPTEKEIRHAIRNNICRCTGYVKIVQAIELASQLLREDRQIHDDSNWLVNTSTVRVDVRDKVTGAAVYPDDMYMENQLNVVAVRSKYPRARILSIDASKALELEDVHVITAQDIPGDHKVGHLMRDWPAIIGIGEVTRYLGDVIALVAAPERSMANRARELVKVTYEVLPFVSDPYQAMKDDAPSVHEGKSNLLGETHVDRGDVDKALAESDFVLSEVFHTPWTEHAFLEPECAFSVPLENGGVRIYSTDQGVYDTRRETAPLLNLPEEKVLVENCYVGGGFGGKEDVTVQHLSALCALITQRPCKMKLTRQESILVHPKRHPMDIEMTMGISKDGKIRGLKARVIADTGAYASLGLPVLQRACTHASGPYSYENFRIDGYAYYTNNPPAGAFRGFGVTQTCFAVERLLSRLADKAGIDHWRIRYINAIRPGQSLPNGQITDEATDLVGTLEAVKDDFYSHRHTGIACAMKNAGVGVGIPDTGRVTLEVRGGKVIIHCAGSCIGQGLCTVLKQIICTTSGLAPDLVIEEKANTENAPDSGTTSGSRHTTVTGEAARRAGLLLRKALETESLSELEGRFFSAEYLAKTDPFGSDKPHPKSHVAYGYATHLCILDEKSHKIDSLIAAHDVGLAINPRNVEGQIEGGVVMGLGYALRENFPLKDCRPLATYGSLGLFQADEVPTVKAVVVEKSGLDTSFGAKGVGEITSIPTAPAVADAYELLDGESRNILPITHTPYARGERGGVFRKVKTLTVNPDARCIGCLECVRACARTYSKTERQAKALLRITQKEGVGNASGIRGLINRPAVCVQCGKCAAVCPYGAISQNQNGVYSVDLKLCQNCGKCREICPVKVIIEDDGLAKKCIACGICAKACPTGVLQLALREKK